MNRQRMVPTFEIFVLEGPPEERETLNHYALAPLHLMDSLSDDILAHVFAQGSPSDMVKATHAALWQCDTHVGTVAAMLSPVEHADE